MITTTKSRGMTLLLVLAVVIAIYCFLLFPKKELEEINIPIDTPKDETIIMLTQKRPKIGKTYSHAMLKHPEEAPLVEKCFDENGVFQLWQSSNKDALIICKIDESTFGVQVVKKIDGSWEEITEYIYQKISSEKELVDYLGETLKEVLMWTAK